MSTQEIVHKPKRIKKEQKQLAKKWKVLIYTVLLFLLLSTIAKVPYFTSIVDYVIEYFFGFSKYIIYFFLVLLSIFWWTKKIRKQIFNRYTIPVYVLFPIIFSLFLGYIAYLNLVTAPYIFVDGHYAQIFSNLWSENFFLSISHLRYYFLLKNIGFGGIIGYTNLDLYIRHIVIFMIVLLSFVFLAIFIFFGIYVIRNRKHFYKAKLWFLNKLVKNINDAHKKQFVLFDETEQGISVEKNINQQPTQISQSNESIESQNQITPNTPTVITTKPLMVNDQEIFVDRENAYEETKTKTSCVPTAEFVESSVIKSKLIGIDEKEDLKVVTPPKQIIYEPTVEEEKNPGITSPTEDVIPVVYKQTKASSFTKKLNLTDDNSGFKKTQKFTLSIQELLENKQMSINEKVVFSGDEDYYHELNNMINKVDHNFMQFARLKNFNFQLVHKSTYFSVAEVVYSADNLDLNEFISQNNLIIIEALSLNQNDAQIKLYQQNKNLAIQITSRKFNSSFSLKNEIMMLDDIERENFNLIYGKDKNREVVWSNESDGNLIIYGSAKGSGRSMLISNLVLGCLLTHKSSDIDLYLFDDNTKLTKTFANLRHTRKVINFSNPYEVINQLKNIQTTFNDIKNTMISKGVDNFYELNHMSNNQYKLSLLVMSEFATMLSSPYKDRFLILMQNIIALSASVGCLVVLATEVVDESTSTWAEMFENIAILKLNNEYESTLISKHNWLHNLNGMGDLVLMKANSEQVLRLQIAKITNDEIASLIKKLDN
ncbi:FtsK/SpoIIIE domain-containing protein [Ureaplasma sp. ES3154-GEN]|uniref:FtsK/SpoIIIE domain-containing protein n=1 Tax=Ureaplasma sp. ES3154-GEN TaxID=2984844 RepID=UPI0021E76398|nr:FtsK/SpoIIIE domain-containing protein [Ureaplasma sp. ES3154-GEN]MCV3743644.1 FtsK/SpoIIIE domain-containing protein [Ureaplasma sp. ES3154-GEN]